jgi:hypothetical protein
VAAMKKEGASRHEKEGKYSHEKEAEVSKPGR